MRLSVLDQSPVPEGTAPAAALQHTLELAALADRLGYHRYWVAEHHASPFQAGSAPEVLIGQILARTSGIRVGSGGVLLPYYSPFKVAEVFRVLHALHPGRVDLGVGKAHLSKDPVVRALRRDAADPAGGDDFRDKVEELRTFLVGGGFPEGHPYGDLRPSPAAPGHPELWVLGSSVSSAEATARAGLSYAYAHFLGPDHTVDAIRRYREEFVPHVVHGRPLGEPRVVLGIGVYCAETEDEAHALLAGHRLFRHRMDRGVMRPVPSTQQAIEELGAEVALAGDPGPGHPGHDPYVRNAVGTPEQVRAHLTALAEVTGVDEVVLINSIHDHKARLRCYELVAEVFGLAPRPEPAQHQTHP
ncbi:LLM class flavin-dependent oxidoreductase [Streptomyces sp. CA-210063]|uniref:LLM class flavin-dependent oxidoreductase n=1 Tax=Streptomyces sp. CA-210063 TaxID=2801029 RepID=UPI00214D08A4|nr:LLM class flavin-dependent oxidoreductase [Streptomyces sp. CA-210063]UUU30221.1 LLM class flavin-dependent oxidoreductase [Streptomyces sp. CA-210063]